MAPLAPPAMPMSDRGMKENMIRIIFAKSELKNENTRQQRNIPNKH